MDTEFVFFLGNRKVICKVLRSVRRTLTLRIEDSNTVVIKAPKRMNDKQVQSLLLDNTSLLERKLEKKLNQESLPSVFNCADGAVVQFYDRSLYISVIQDDERRENVSLKGDTLVVRVNDASSEAIENKVEEWFRKSGKQVIEGRALYFAEMMGVTFGRITLRDQKTRWGSCSKEGNLNFNWRLLLMPPEYLDYVVVHELAHRKHMDHSREFWSEVERIYPRYRKLRKWLKDNGSRYQSN